MKKATPAQIGAINGILAKRGLLDQKQQLVQQYTEGRETSTKEMLVSEARQMISDLLKDQETPKDEKDKGPMVKKLFSMAHEIGWIEKKQIVGKDGSIVEVNDNSHLYRWVEKYGYLKKQLREYTYNELPKLVSAFEQNVYNRYIGGHFRKNTR